MAASITGIIGIMRKTALITGATSGIGEACARKFAEGGYDIIITARRADKLEALKAELEAVGVEVKTLVFDVRDAKACEDAVRSLDGKWACIENVYKGITPLTGADIADVAFYAASAPKHVQIAEVLILATHQASGSVVCRK